MELWFKRNLGNKGKKTAIQVSMSIIKMCVYLDHLFINPMTLKGMSSQNSHRNSNTVQSISIYHISNFLKLFFQFKVFFSICVLKPYGAYGMRKRFNLEFTLFQKQYINILYLVKNYFYWPLLHMFSKCVEITLYKIIHKIFTTKHTHM